MSNEHILLEIQALAAALDGSRAESEQVIDELDKNLKSFPDDKRKSIDEALTVVVGQLSRLKLRNQN
jgi:hypothetical protein